MRRRWLCWVLGIVLSLPGVGATAVAAAGCVCGDETAWAVVDGAVAGAAAVDGDTAAGVASGFRAATTGPTTAAPSIIDPAHDRVLASIDPADDRWLATADAVATCCASIDGAAGGCAGNCSCVHHAPVFAVLPAPVAWSPSVPAADAAATAGPAIDDPLPDRLLRPPKD